MWPFRKRKDSTEKKPGLPKPEQVRVMFKEARDWITEVGKEIDADTQMLEDRDRARLHKQKRVNYITHIIKTIEYRHED